MLRRRPSLRLSTHQTSSSALEQSVTKMASNKACAAGHQYSHGLHMSPNSEGSAKQNAPDIAAGRSTQASGNAQAADEIQDGMTYCQMADLDKTVSVGGDIEIDIAESA